MTIKTDPENLRYPIGKFLRPSEHDKTTVNQWIDQIASFPFEVFKITSDLTEEQLNWAYRPDGWSIRQLVHHCADSHLNSYIRFKWTLTEDAPTIKAYEEAAWAELSDSRSAEIRSSLNILDGLHERWVYLLRSLDAQHLELYFVHPETGKKVPLWVNISLYAWHCKHHFAHMQLALEFEGKYKQKR